MHRAITIPVDPCERMVSICFHSLAQPRGDMSIEPWQSVWARALDGFLYAIYQEFKEAYPPCTAPAGLHATRSPGSRPAKIASRLSNARKPMASRVSRVALPICGSRKVLSSSR